MTAIITKELMEKTGLTRQQVQWWEKQGFITPTEESKGRGYDLEWDESLIPMLRKMQRLAATGMRIAACHEVATTGRFEDSNLRVIFQR